MSGRTVLLALVALLLAAALAVSRYFPEYLPWAAAGTRRTAAPEARELPLETTAAERLARIDARLRLAPDRRALAALGEIRRLVRGGAAGDAEIVYVSGSWKIGYAGDELGILSTYPRFSALLTLLDTQAAKERSRPGAVQLAPDVAIRPELHTLLNRFDDPAAFELLAGVDATWRTGKASVGDLLAATEALAQLCLILPRDFPAADRLAARALASIALARQYAPDRALRAEITLAYALGYVEHAAALAERLPRDEPLAAFVRRDFGALERVAEWSDSGDVRFYYAARMAAARSADEWIDWYRKLSPERAADAAVVRTALEEPDPKLGEFVPELYATTLLTRFGVPVAAPLSRCDALAREVERSASGRSGPFADTALYTDSLRAACLSALYRKLVFLAETKKNPEAALALARSLPQDAALRDWTELAAGDRRRARESAPRLAKAVATPSGLGLDPRLRLARRALEALDSSDPRRIDVADALANWLDTRPDTRVVAGDLAREVYLDPDLQEKLYAAALDVDRLERPVLAARLAAFQRDWLALWSLAESDAFRLDARMAALEGLERQKPLESMRLRRGYERLLTVYTGSEPLRRQFARYLEKTLRNRKAARMVLIPILAEYKEHDPASDSVAGIVARLYREEGDPRSAWELLEPRVAGMGVPYEAARAQVALGNLARAEEIARAAYAHYKHSLAPAAELAAVLWEAQRNAEAAEVIAKFPVRASDKERCYHFCRAFVRTFRSKPRAEVEAAFREMVAARLDYPLLQGTIAIFRDTADPETALALGKLVDAPDASAVHTETYKTLKQMRGEAEAMTWLATMIPRERLGPAAKTFYDSNADELLWKLVDDPDHQGGLATWLLRAGAYSREEHPIISHRQALAAYFGAHRTTADEQLGAALVGLIDDATLLAGARTERDLTRAAYALGARLEARRDVRGAMRMYQLALTSPRGTPGRELAYAAASRIVDLGASLDALGKDPVRSDAVVASAP